MTAPAAAESATVSPGQCPEHTRTAAQCRVAELAAQAPPLSSDQRERLRALLRY